MTTETASARRSAAAAEPSMQERVAELRDRRAAVEGGGGEKRLARQREGGRLTARERVAELFDAGTFTESAAFDRGAAVPQLGDPLLHGRLGRRGGPGAGCDL